MDLFRTVLCVTLVLTGSTVSAVETPGLLRIREVLRDGSQPVRIVCFGDSVTGVYYHSGSRRAYPELLAEGLARLHPETEVEVINAGRSGHTTSNGLARIQQDVLGHRPHLVTVMFGLNDVAKGSLPLYRKNLAEIVTRCRTAGAEVLLCTPNAVSETAERPVAAVATHAEVVRQIAAEMGVPLADLHGDLEEFRRDEPRAWRLSMSDEIHPNLGGHRRIAAEILGVIEGEAVTPPNEVRVPEPLAFTLAKIQKGQSLRILAMPPADAVVAALIREVRPGASVEVTSWPVAGLDRRGLMKDAAHRVRPQAPDLVIVSVPRSAAAADEEEFIRTQMWIASNSLSRERRAWDVVVVHPSVWEGPGGEAELAHDALIRAIVPSQDLPLVDRGGNDARDGAAILRDWLAGEL